MNWLGCESTAVIVFGNNGLFTRFMITSTTTAFSYSLIHEQPASCATTLQRIMKSLSEIGRSFDLGAVVVTGAAVVVAAVVVAEVVVVAVVVVVVSDVVAVVSSDVVVTGAVVVVVVEAASSLRP